MNPDPSPSGRKRVLSGMRPTGKLHLGNYMGALYNWVRLQDQYECFFFIADYHALTTDYADTSRLLENIYEIAIDFLSAGLDPAKCSIFVQSHVPQHAELHLLFSMFTPLSWLERVPTYKDQQEQLREKDLATYGFLGYPLLQSADILVYQPQFVPVGQDQVAHVELTREVARKFNQLYSPRRVVPGENLTAGGALQMEPDPDRLILPEPEVLLTPSPKLPGVDGRKMSKSYGNSILLSDHPEVVSAKMARMSNGGQRNPQTLPGNPDVCPVGDIHAVFSEEHTKSHIRQGCVSASITCGECRQLAASSIVMHLQPIYIRREQLERDPQQVWNILEQGSLQAARRAEQTMQAVRAVTGLSRTARPVPLLNRLQSAQGMQYAQPHDLSAQDAWWEIDRAFRQRNLVEFWRSHLLPTEVMLREDADGILVAGKAKRVLALAAREEPDNWWEFRARVRTFEAMALLCWDKTRTLYDFIVPQIAYVAAWTRLKKLHKKDEIIFSVQHVNHRFFLILEGAEPIDITSCRGQYNGLG